MKIKSFNDFEKRYSNDYNTFSKKVAIASIKREDHPFFSVIKDRSDLYEKYQGYPVIIDEGFSTGPQLVFENSAGVYNSNSAPDLIEISRKMSDNPYLPKVSTSIRDIRKGFRFPVIAKSEKRSDSYKTIGKLRSSEINYDTFMENPDPRTRFKILVFKGEPVSIVEWINKFPIDVDMNSFEYLKESIEISKLIWEHLDLDLCNVEIIESIKGDIIIKSVSTDLNLNPIQEKVVYEKVYEDHYGAKLPNWFKIKIFNDHVLPYYKRRENDVKLIKSRHSMDYSKVN